MGRVRLEDLFDLDNNREFYQNFKSKRVIKIIAIAKAVKIYVTNLTQLISFNLIIKTTK